jgi:hypothetical protein
VGAGGVALGGGTLVAISLLKKLVIMPSNWPIVTGVSVEGVVEVVVAVAEEVLGG